jgi:hypothetical protein
MTDGVTPRSVNTLDFTSSRVLRIGCSSAELLSINSRFAIRREKFLSSSVCRRPEALQNNRRLATSLQAGSAASFAAPVS